MRADLRVICAVFSTRKKPQGKTRWACRWVRRPAPTWGGDRWVAGNARIRRCRRQACRRTPDGGAHDRVRAVVRFAGYIRPAIRRRPGMRPCRGVFTGIFRSFSRLNFRVRAHHFLRGAGAGFAVGVFLRDFPAVFPDFFASEPGAGGFGAAFFFIITGAAISAGAGRRAAATMV